MHIERNLTSSAYTYVHTHAHTHALTHAHTHARTHTHSFPQCVPVGFLLSRSTVHSGAFARA